MLSHCRRRFYQADIKKNIKKTNKKSYQKAKKYLERLIIPDPRIGQGQWRNRRSRARNEKIESLREKWQEKLSELEEETAPQLARQENRIDLGQLCSISTQFLAENLINCEEIIATCCSEVIKTRDSITRPKSGPKQEATASARARQGRSQIERGTKLNWAERLWKIHRCIQYKVNKNISR